jgi:hypothetical protein
MIADVLVFAQQTFTLVAPLPMKIFPVDPKHNSSSTTLPVAPQVVSPAQLIPNTYNNTYTPYNRLTMPDKTKNTRTQV